MRHYRFLLIIGFIVLVTPFLGIPSGIKEVVFFVVAVLIFAQSMILRAVYRKQNRNYEDTSYVESRFGKDEEEAERETIESPYVEDDEVEEVYEFVEEENEEKDQS